MQVLTREKCFRGNSTPLDRLAIVLSENLIKNFENQITQGVKPENQINLKTR